MNNIPELIFNAIGGLFLGSFFYLGLYWTVKKGLTSKRPALLFSLSFFIRSAVLLSGILLLGKGVFINFVACAFGIVFSRLIVFIVNQQASKNQQVNS